MRVSYSELHDILFRVLGRTGFTRERATRCAALFADASRDGVYTHGLNRFPQFITTIRNGVVDVDAVPRCLARWGALERWDGRRGAGNLNAQQSMARAIDLSHDQGIGALVAYRTRGEALPVAGGYDAEGRLTCDAAAIEASGRLL